MHEIPTTVYHNSRIDSELLALCGIGLGLVAILGVILIAVVSVVAVYKRRILLDEMEATIKMEMIQRGQSAADIERVLQARAGMPRRKSLASIFETLVSARRPTASNPQTKQG